VRVWWAVSGLYYEILLEALDQAGSAFVLCLVILSLNPNKSKKQIVFF
jgi:hypothetical protein